MLYLVRQYTKCLCCQFFCNRIFHSPFYKYSINTQIALKSSICVLNEYLQNGFVFLDVKYNVLNSSLNIIIHLISDINKRLNQNKTVKLILKNK